MNLMQKYRSFLRGELRDLRQAHQLHEILVRYPQITDLKIASPDEDGPIEAIGAPRAREVYFGMTTPREQAYCEWFASHLYKGVGDWVELGTFLGSLTKPAVRGLEANSDPNVKDKKVRVYDLFYWDPVMVNTVKGTLLEGCCDEGDWYVDFYKEYISDVIRRVDVQQTSLTDFRYSGEAIEFLIVDVMKYERLVANVLQEFFPCLLPHDGYVFHQDYLHFYEGWITLSMYRLRNYFSHICTIEGSMGVVFQCRTAIPPEMVSFPEKSAEIDRDWIDEAFDWSFGLIDGKHHHEIAATKVMMLVHSERWDDAKRLYAEYCGRYAGSPAMADLHQYVSKHRRMDLAAG
jgi:hypothetical protein